MCPDFLIHFYKYFLEKMNYKITHYVMLILYKLTIYIYNVFRFFIRSIIHFFHNK